MPTSRLRTFHRLAALTLLLATLAAWLASDFCIPYLAYAPSKHQCYSLCLYQETLRFESEDLTHYTDIPLEVAPGWDAGVHPHTPIPLVPEPELHPALLGFFCGSYDNAGSFGTYSRNFTLAVPFWFLALLAYLHYRRASPSRPRSARPSPRWQIPVLTTLFLTTLAFWTFTDFYCLAIVHHSSHTNYVLDENFDALSFETTHIPLDIDARISFRPWYMYVTKQPWTGDRYDKYNPILPTDPATLLGFSAGHWDAPYPTGKTLFGTRLSLPFYFPALLLAHFLHRALKSRGPARPSFPLEIKQPEAFSTPK